MGRISVITEHFWTIQTWCKQECLIDEAVSMHAMVIMWQQTTLLLWSYETYISHELRRRGTALPVALSTSPLKPHSSSFVPFPLAHTQTTHTSSYKGVFASLCSALNFQWSNYADGQKCVDLVILTFDILSYKLIRQLHVSLTNFSRNFGLCRAFHFWVRRRQGTGRWGAIHNAAFWPKGRLYKTRMRLKHPHVQLKGVFASLGVLLTSNVLISCFM